MVERIHQSICESVVVEKLSTWKWWWVVESSGVRSHESPLSGNVICTETQTTRRNKWAPPLCQPCNPGYMVQPHSCLGFLISKKRMTEQHLLPGAYMKMKHIIICKVLRTVPGTSSNSNLKAETDKQMLLMQHVLFLAYGSLQDTKSKERRVPNPAGGIREASLEGMMWNQSREEGNWHLLSTKFLALGNYYL